METLTLDLIWFSFGDSTPFDSILAALRSREGFQLRRVQVNLHALFSSMEAHENGERFVDRFNSCFEHSKGKLLSVNADPDEGEQWFWEEENGGVLKLST